jgi:hypothetical protein
MNAPTAMTDAVRSMNAPTAMTDATTPLTDDGDGRDNMDGHGRGVQLIDG